MLNSGDMQKPPHLRSSSDTGYMRKMATLPRFPA